MPYKSAVYMRIHLQFSILYTVATTAVVQVALAAYVLLATQP